MKFRTLFTLRVRHEYYPDAICPDFRIEAASSTQSALQNHRCILKPLPDGIRVATAMDERDQPQISFAAGTSLVFQLHLLNPDLPLFTDLTGVGVENAPCFTNQGRAATNGVVSLGVKQRKAKVTERFVLREGTKVTSFQLAGRPVDGCEGSDFVLDGVNGPVSLKTYDSLQRTITVERSGPQSPERSFTATYPVNPLRPRNTFAEVELVLDDALVAPAAIPAEFRIELKARSAVWRYYLCTNRTLGPGKAFSIGSSEPAFGPVQPELNDPLVKTLEAQNPESKVWCFDSVQARPCRQVALKDIQLKVGADTLLAPLPNPSFRSLCQINKEVAFFEVIKDAVAGVASRKP
ncbi:MAG TPA: hypothetical protein PLX89_20095 [Verrucomicrobiota bacterium]|nr:hypothetical protein [Verrucomicrobiales bacterium]HRI15302.1 hypothetical protein [Verrucomicrobiota bacterium]